MKLFSKHISNQTIFTIMATTVSICALAVSVMQTYYQHKYLYASSWPHIEASTFHVEGKDSTQHSTTIKIFNKGIGPAIVESFTCQYKGKKMEDMSVLIKSISEKKFSGSYRGLASGEVIAQNETFDLMSFTGAKGAKLFSEALSDIKMRIVYTSVHDQRWEYIYDSTLPEGEKTNRLN